VNKLIKIALYNDLKPIETAFILTPDPGSSKRLYSLLPWTWQTENVRLWDWNFRSLKVEDLITERLTGGMWVFLSESPGLPDDYYNRYRAYRSRHISESLQLEIFSPVISLVKPLQKKNLNEQILGISLWENKLCIVDKKKVTAFLSTNLGRCILEQEHPFRNISSFIVKGDRLLVIDNGSLKAFSFSQGREMPINEPVHADFDLSAIFPSRNGYYLLDKDGDIYSVTPGRFNNVLEGTSVIPPANYIIELSDSSILITAGDDIYHLKLTSRDIERIYSSKEGSLLLCAFLKPFIAINDGRMIKIINLDHKDNEIASFSSTGFGEPFTNPLFITSNQKDRLFVVDNDTLYSYQLFRYHYQKDECIKYKFIDFYPSLPEGPIILDNGFLEFLWKIKGDSSLTPDDHRDLIIEYARKKEFLSDISGIVAINQAMDFLGINCFLAIHSDRPELFFYMQGEIYRLDDSFQLIRYEGRRPAYIDIEEMKELLENAQIREYRIQTFISSLYEIRSGIEKDYQLVVVENDFNVPFKVTDSIKENVIELIKGKDSEVEKAKAIFNWFMGNIKYGEEMKEKKGAGYFDSIEVFTHKEGICGEMAILYITMARVAGMKVNYISVSKDYKGKEVSHACAGVYINDQLILVDPAYRQFDIKHQEYKLINDEDFYKRFKKWDR
jgi:hypothetical protein